MYWKLCVALLLSLTQVSHLKYVSSVLNANWRGTPLFLETSEFFAEEDSALFFKFAEEFGGDESSSSEKDDYEELIEAASEMLPTVSVSLLKLSLSLRQYSPRLDMFNKIAESVVGNLGCNIFLQIATKPHCWTSDSEQLISSSSSKDRVKLIKYDHVYRDNPELTQVILYCDIRKYQCHERHMKLIRLADLGQISYVFRHNYEPGAGKVQLSGYGVELAVKSTEYNVVDDTVVTEENKEGLKSGEEEEEVDGFRFGYLKQKYPDKVDDLNKFKEFLTDSKNAMLPLKAWEIADLGYQAAQKVVSAAAGESLSVLSKYSQNLPSLARSLSRTVVKPELKTEVKQNQKILERYGVQPGSSVLLLNGMLIDLEGADPFTLLKKLRSEAKTVGGLSSLDISFSDINQLLKSDLFKHTTKYGVDMRDDAVLYINDLEKDPQYAHWPGQLHELLRPSYPGMLKQLRRNLYNVAFLLRPGHPSCQILVNLIAALLENNAPVRIGLIFTSDSEESASNIDSVIPAMINKIMETKGRVAVGEFLVELTDDGLTLDNARSEFSDLLGLQVTDEFVSENNPLVVAGNQLLLSSGLAAPSMVVNGVVLDDLTSAEETLLETLQAQLPKLQRAVYLGEVNDKTNILDWYMQDASILPRHNPQIMDPKAYTLPLADLDKSGPQYTDLDETLKESNWLGAEKAPVSMVIVGDYESSQGKQLLLSTLLSVEKLQQSRFTLLFTSDTDMNYRVWSVLQNTPSDKVVVTMRAVLLGDHVELEERSRDDFSEIVKKHSAVAHVVLHVTHGNTAVLCNGRVVTPLHRASSEDLQLIETLELRSGAEKLKEIMTGYSSDVVMRAASLLRRQEPVKRISFPELKVEHSAAIVPGDGPFQVEAVLDPLSAGAQQISQILHVLHSAGLITLRIFLNPIDKLSEIPVKRFYRYVLEPELRFNGDGNIADTGSRFTDLLPHLLLTMSLSTPINWMVASTHSPYDLDNIRLNDVEKGVYAEYTLEYLVIEGHSHDPTRYNNPTKGLQYDLTSGDTSHDTIVMANLGYFQLKAGPGLWTLSLRDGPSKEIYQITGVEGPGDLEGEGQVLVTVGDLTSTFITVEASKKEGMAQRSISAENESQNDDNSESSGIWSSIKNIVGSNAKEEGSTVHETIHIFSVASGHLYERMLGVMMQSVLANTKLLLSQSDDAVCTG
ncbi:UDP-glucose:glycoprotein glucosyltransferase 1-like isoform X2 [Bolinopsis microptera]|uniref:UDP-glucose:glycoprotein glucosyltransferase 1-like isoform X2 n=1 Tax=Bolinopsis microptera TaxID=2820187 RepID=UPI00307ABC51